MNCFCKMHNLTFIVDTNMESVLLLLFKKINQYKLVYSSLTFKKIIRNIIRRLYRTKIRNNNYYNAINS